jgi:hypothetical protein
VQYSNVAFLNPGQPPTSAPDEVVDRLGEWREKTGITRVYLQLLDLADLDQVELIASQVAPQLDCSPKRSCPARRVS